MIHALDKDLGDMQISEFKTKEMAGLMQPEPLLTADSSRFVLFPIKHSDVRQSTKKIAPVLNHSSKENSTTYLNHPNSYPSRFGKCIRKPRRPSGQQKSLICPAITKTGTTCPLMKDISSPTSLPFSLRLTESLMRTWHRTSRRRSNAAKHAASMASRLQSRISTPKCTPCSLTLTSKTQRRKPIC